MLPNSLNPRNIIAILSVNQNVKKRFCSLPHVKIFDNLTEEKMKDRVKKITKKRGDTLSNGCGHMITLEGVPEKPILIAVVKSGVFYPTHPPVCKSWTKVV